MNYHTFNSEENYIFIVRRIELVSATLKIVKQGKKMEEMLPCVDHTYNILVSCVCYN
jgi:hypothetical protein